MTQQCELFDQSIWLHKIDFYHQVDFAWINVTKNSQ